MRRAREADTSKYKTLTEASVLLDRQSWRGSVEPGRSSLTLPMMKVLLIRYKPHRYYQLNHRAPVPSLCVPRSDLPATNTQWEVPGGFCVFERQLLLSSSMQPDSAFLLCSLRGRSRSPGSMGRPAACQQHLAASSGQSSFSARSWMLPGEPQMT